MKWRFVVVVILFWPLQAAAVELRHIHVVTGTKGLNHVPITVSNTRAEALSCTIQLAHWYSMRLADTAPEGHSVIDLWFDPATGTYVILNAGQDNMPVEALWCGISGRAYQTRADIALDRSKGAAPLARQIACAGADDRLVCN